MGFILLLNLLIVTQNFYADELSFCENNNINFKAYFHGGGNPDLEWSTYVNSRSPYEKFVVELVNHVKAILSNEAACKEGALDKPEISLIFVERQFPVYQGEQTLKVEPSLMNNFSCQLLSPWLDMTIQRSPSFEVSAVFNFEDRQFLIDQALLTYPHLAATFEPVALTDHLYKHYEQEFFALRGVKIGKVSPETIPHIPMDMLWLFIHTPKESAGIYEILRLVQANYLGYTKIAKALVSHSFASDGSYNFKTINELKPFYGAEALNDYKNKSHYRIDKERN